MKGEALGLRAFLHFDLLRMFGPVFAMEPQGKAIPYRTVFSNEPTPVLPATEVVDACLADLHQADSLLWEADQISLFMTSMQTRFWSCVSFV